MLICRVNQRFHARQLRKSRSVCALPPPSFLLNVQLSTFDRRSRPCRDFQLFRHTSSNSFPCHTSENSPVSPTIATDPKTHLSKSCTCHTSETPRGWLLSASAASLNYSMESARSASGIFQTFNLELSTFGLFDLSPFLSHSCALFCTFLHSRKTHPVCFQAVPHSCAKHAGVGGGTLC